MKKNVMMRAASALLVMALLTTCVISGTFAKYTTSATGSDSARIAYWGFNKDATINIDLFDGTYDGSVAGKDGANVIAPGTSKTTTFAFGSVYTPNSNNGNPITAPEVDYTLTITPEITGKHSSLDNNANFKWTLKGPDDTAAREYNNVAELSAAIKALNGINGTRKYKAGQLPDVFTDTSKVYTIGWKWAFETADDTAQDVTDTNMGNAAVLGNITFRITITATQID